MNSEPKPQKETGFVFFLKNEKYRSISIYAILVILIGCILAKAILSFEDTITLFKNALSVCMPFIIGLLIAYMMNPYVMFVNHFLSVRLRIFKRKTRIFLSILICYFTIIGALILILTYIVPEVITSISEVVTQLPGNYENLRQTIWEFEANHPSVIYSSFNQALDSFSTTLLNLVQNYAGNLVPRLYSLSLAIFDWLANMVIAIIVSVYMLTDKKILLHGIRSLVYLCIPSQYLDLFDDVFHRCNQIFNSFVLGKTTDSLLIGILSFIIFSIFQIPYAMLISLIVGITNMIPYFGPFIGAVPGFLIIVMVSPIKSLLFLFLILCIQQFDGLYLGPKILGNSTGLRPLWIILAITLGGSIGGVLGMFLSVPIVGCLRYIYLLFIDHMLLKRTDIAERLQNTKDQDFE